MPRISAGLLMYRRDRAGGLQVLLVHPGGPFWANRDAGAWTIPKGEVADGEELLVTARREFEEETGTTAGGPFQALEPVKQKGGKIVHAWAVEGDLDASAIRCNTFTMEWPLKSGKFATFPEVDRAAWFTPAEAREKINAAQIAFVDELEAMLR